MNQTKWILALSAGIVAIALGSFFSLITLIALAFPGEGAILFTSDVVFRLVFLGIGFLGQIVAGSFACTKPKLKFGKYSNNLYALIGLAISSAILVITYLIVAAYVQAFVFSPPLILVIISIAMRHPQNSYDTQFESVMAAPLSEEERLRQEIISATLRHQSNVQPNSSPSTISIETTRKLIALQKLLNDGTITQQEYNNLYSSYINGQQ